MFSKYFRLIFNGTKPGPVVIETEEILVNALEYIYLTIKPNKISDILRAMRDMSMDYFCMASDDFDIEHILGNPYLAARLNLLTPDVTYSLTMIEDNNSGEVQISTSTRNIETEGLKRKIVPIYPGILITADIIIKCLSEQRTFPIKINRIDGSRTEISICSKNRTNILEALTPCLNRYLVTAKPCRAKSARNVVS
jgi:hypothetical protein